MIENLNIETLIERLVSEPDLIDFFGETEDEINDWKLEVEDKIGTLTSQAIREVWERKRSVQTGFEKLKYLKFDRNILSYQEFRRRWRLKVVPERKPAQLELAALREALTATAKAKITEVMSIKEALCILNLHYSD